MAWLKRIGFSLAALLMAAWVINEYMVVKTRDHIYPAGAALPPVEAVIVPGASVHRSGQLSPVLKQRMEAALRVLSGRPGTKLVLSGFVIPKGYNETQAMADFALKSKVPPEDILLDEKGRSTYVTLLNCRRKWGFRKVLVVSQDYHLPRALYIARNLGMEASGLVAAEAPSTPRFHLREYAGRVKDFILLRISKYFNAN